MTKRTKKIIGSVAAVLACGLIIGVGYGAWGYISGNLAGGDVNNSSNIDVIAGDTEDVKMKITSLAADGRIVFGPYIGDSSGYILDEQVAEEQESLTATVSFTITTSTTDTGNIYFNLTPSQNADDYSTYVNDGYILDPIAGATSDDIGTDVIIATFAYGVASVGSTYNEGSKVVSSNTVYSVTGQSAGYTVSIDNTKVEDTVFTFDVTITLTFGWGAEFGYMNPSKYEEQDGVTSSDVLDAITAMYDSFNTNNLKFSSSVFGRYYDYKELKLLVDYNFYENCGDLGIKGTSIATDDDTTLEFFYTAAGVDSADEDPLVSIGDYYVTVMGSNSSGGAYTGSNFLRVGNSSYDGYFTLNYAEGINITRAVITAHAYSNAYTTNTLTVNGVNNNDNSYVAYDGTAGTYTYDFTASNSILIKSTRTFILEIALYYLV